ncbi:HEXXH motif domain-containing protein [Streptomyces tibetensis]|uniref:HEXXH motif domain-containing protein n=1 Tax=Streptomyces tibetensis TaxID=2382123 RepID=UPI00380F2FBB
MTSELAFPHFRVPARFLAELATGGGSQQAITCLERAERARRLLLLRTLLDRLDGLSTPLTPPAEAWQVVKESAALAPEPINRLLLAPATGGWIAHLLRRVHGTASGPPVWAEAGYLCALAVTAALHAGTVTMLRVPLTDGRLYLPGLGLAGLTDAAPGWTVGRAHVSRGELTLTGTDRSGAVTSSALHPATAPLPLGAPNRSSVHTASPNWLPLRALTHTGPTGTVSIPLDDLGPYRDLDDPLPPARLDAAEAEAWQRLFESAAAQLAQPGAAGPGRLDPALIRAVVPWGRTSVLPPAPPAVRVSASSGDSFGAMVIARPSSPVALAETLVHEFQHSKLAALLHLFPMVDDDRQERYYAPWRPDPRHLTGLLHGAYAFTGVAGFWRDRLAVAEDERAADLAGYHFALRRQQSRLVVRTLLVEGRLTPQGRALVSGLARTLDAWLREPVPETALARARAAAALHRTEWRLRNIAPPGSAGRRVPRTRPAPSSHAAPDGATVTAPRTLDFRPDRAPWTDHRTHGFACPPARPSTPDEHLAAGNPAAALDGYATSLAAGPPDPHVLAGWMVARAVLHPGPASRRMLARPEAFRCPARWTTM